jgi:hypothetical protein
MWGFWDADHWLQNSPLYASDWRLKPSGRRWINLVSGWKTPRANLSTDAGGAAFLRGFYGDYRVTVAARGKTCVYDVSLLSKGVTTLPLC